MRLGVLIFSSLLAGCTGGGNSADPSGGGHAGSGTGNPSTLAIGGASNVAGASTSLGGSAATGGSYSGGMGAGSDGLGQGGVGAAATGGTSDAGGSGSHLGGSGAVPPAEGGGGSGTGGVPASGGMLGSGGGAEPGCRSGDACPVEGDSCVTQAGYCVCEALPTCGGEAEWSCIEPTVDASCGSGVPDPGASCSSVGLECLYCTQEGPRGRICSFAQEWLEIDGFRSCR